MSRSIPVLATLLFLTLAPAQAKPPGPLQRMSSWIAETRVGAAVNGLRGRLLLRSVRRLNKELASWSSLRNLAPQQSSVVAVDASRLGIAARRMTRVRKGIYNLAGRPGFSKELEQGVRRALDKTFTQLDTLGRMDYRYRLGEAAALHPDLKGQKGLVILGSHKELTDNSKAFSQAQRMLHTTAQRKLAPPAQSAPAP